MVQYIRRKWTAVGEDHASIAEDYPHFRRNYALGIVNGVFFNTGLSFFSRSTIVPVFMSSLGAPSAVIALTALFENIGWHLPQFFASRFVVHRAQKLPYYRNASIARLLGLALAILSAWMINTVGALPALVTFVAGFGLFSLAGGFAGIVFTEVLAKTVPKERRGSYFGWRAILSGLIGLSLGVGVINPIIAAFRYPTHYIVLFAIGLTLIAISFVLFLKQKEPAQTGLPAERTMRSQMVRAREILTEDHAFRRFVVFRSMMMLWFSSVPFFMLFAMDRLGAGDAQIGLYISWEFAGLIVANLAWSYISNRIGNRVLLITATVMAMMVSASIGLFDLGVLPVWSFGLVFFMTAAVESGAGNGGLNYALEIVPEPERPTYVGLMNSLLALALGVAAIVGSLRDLIGYVGMFAVTGVVALVAFVLFLRLPEPRHRVELAAIREEI